MFNLFDFELWWDLYDSNFRSIYFIVSITVRRERAFFLATVCSWNVIFIQMSRKHPQLLNFFQLTSMCFSSSLDFFSVILLQVCWLPFISQLESKKQMIFLYDFMLFMLLFHLYLWLIFKYNALLIQLVALHSFFFALQASLLVICKAVAILLRLCAAETFWRFMSLKTFIGALLWSDCRQGPRSAASRDQQIYRSVPLLTTKNLWSLNERPFNRKYVLRPMQNVLEVRQCKL